LVISVFSLKCMLFSILFFAYSIDWHYKGEFYIILYRFVVSYCRIALFPCFHLRDFHKAVGSYINPALYMHLVITSV
jgi:hypothetical protein